jgi:hypothetical protein
MSWSSVRRAAGRRAITHGPVAADDARRAGAILRATQPVARPGEAPQHVTRVARRTRLLPPLPAARRDGGPSDAAGGERTDPEERHP